MPETKTKFKRADIAAIIAANPGKRLYAFFAAKSGFPILGIQAPISKTRAICAARFVTDVKYGTLIELRPDLERYRGRMDGFEAPCIEFVIKGADNA